ncbi:MAG: hypothetical protein HQK83_20655, partial [Fibrobacteria bacterium]|nr:hypothetical protein [Fibrobacteria bacterium]
EPGNTVSVITGDRPPVTIQGAWEFNETSGTTIKAKAGSDGKIIGSGYSQDDKSATVSLGSYISLPRDNMLEGSFTVDIWFSATGAGDHGAARLFCATTGMGGVGPEAFYKYDITSFRMNNSGVTFDSPPSVGTVKNPAGPPDHWAMPSTLVTYKKLMHWIVVHDESKRNVIMYLAEGDETNITKNYEGTYSGEYVVSAPNMVLNDANDPERRRTEQTIFQMIVYNGAFTDDDAQKSHEMGENSLANITNTKKVVDAVSVSKTMKAVPHNSGILLMFPEITEQTGNVDIDIYTKNGKRIGGLQAGSNQSSTGVYWDTRALAAGMYIVQARIGSIRISNPVMVLK